MGQLSPFTPRFHQIQYCIRQFPFAPRAVAHPGIQWGYFFPLLICQVAGIRLSLFSFHVSYFTTALSFCEYRFLNCFRYGRLLEAAKESLSGEKKIFHIASTCKYYLLRACYRLACIRLRRNTRLGKLHPWDMTHCKVSSTEMLFNRKLTTLGAESHLPSE